MKPKYIPLPPKTKFDKLRAYVKKELKSYQGSHPSDEFEEGYAAALRHILYQIDRL